jgi:hypothetical protein
VSQTLTGVTASTFANPSVKYSFQSAVASSCGHGVTADQVNVTSVTDVVNRRLSEAVDQGSVRRQLATNTIKVAYVIIYNGAGSYSSQSEASAALEDTLKASITSGNFTAALIAAASENGLTEVYWVASTNSFEIVATYDSPTPSPTAKANSKSKSMDSTTSLALGIGIGVGVPVVGLIIWLITRFMFGKATVSVGVQPNVNVIPNANIVPPTNAARVGPMNGANR